MKKTINYFPHDFNARNDIKLKKVNMQLGLEGIGLYWCIIEYLYENDGYLTLDEDINLLAYELRIEKDLIINLIENFDLFKKQKNKFYSPSVLSRLETINEKSNVNRENVLKRWKKAQENGSINEIQPNYRGNTTVLQTKYYKKEKKIKENKNKKKENKEDILTTTDNNIYSFIEENFGRLLSGIEYEKINIWLSEWDTEILKYAITIAVMNGIKNFAYIDGILKNWKGRNLKTLSEIKENSFIGLSSKNSVESKMSEEDKKLFDDLENYNWLEDEK